MTVTAKTRKMSLYETDFYSWTQEQAGLLRRGEFDAMDLLHLSEEIETLGRSERAALASAYRLICLHQLKRQERRPLGWANPSDQPSLSFQGDRASEPTKKSATFASDALVQPERSDSRGWTQTIVRERNVVEDILDDNPGLKPHRQAVFERAYKNARREAAAETGLAIVMFSKSPPFTVDEIEDETFWAAPIQA